MTFQMVNLAYESNYTPVLNNLIVKLNDYLLQSKDPRVTGKLWIWDELPYYQENDWIGKPRKEAQEKFGLEEAYSYH